MAKFVDRTIGPFVFILAVGVVVGAAFLVNSEAGKFFHPQTSVNDTMVSDIVGPYQDLIKTDEETIRYDEMTIEVYEDTIEDLQADIRQDEVTIGGLHSTISDLEKKVCPAPAIPVVVEREADPANCAALKEFRGYDETKNSAKDFDYLKFKMQRFNGTNATQESRNRFRCHTLYQGQIWQHKDN